MLFLVFILFFGFSLCFLFVSLSIMFSASWMAPSRLGAHGLLGNLSINGTATRKFGKEVAMQMQLQVFDTTNFSETPHLYP